MPVPALRLYTPAETRKRLGITAPALRYRARTRQLTVVLTPGGHRRYLAAEINEISHCRQDENLPGPAGARVTTASESSGAVMPTAGTDEPLYPLEMARAAVGRAGETRKHCGKQWPAHQCAPGANHSCSRPPDHKGSCACACGHWNSAPELDPEVTVVAGSMPPHQHSQPVDDVRHNVLIGAQYSIPHDIELIAECQPCQWRRAFEAGVHDLADFINLYAQHAGIDAARQICATTLYTHVQQHEAAS